MALVSDAGMPGISDPGQDLVSAAAAVGVPVVPVPGPSAPVTALAASGIPADRFLYLGFLPRVRADRRRLLNSVARLPYSLVAFEAPHRLQAALTDLQDSLGDRPAAIGRELTKLHEEILRGRISELRAIFKERAPRGEFTLVIGPAEPSSELEAPSALDLVALARQLRADGSRGKDAVRELMEKAGAGRREAYQAWLDST